MGPYSEEVQKQILIFSFEEVLNLNIRYHTVFWMDALNSIKEKMSHLDNSQSEDFSFGRIHHCFMMNSLILTYFLMDPFSQVPNLIVQLVIASYLKMPC
jgi:hypothetical protein